jgi:hypothetical protein
MTLSMDNYAPLVDFWAARGFVVIQPTHLDSLGLAPDDPRTPLIWRIRTDDLTCILDQTRQVPRSAARTRRQFVESGPPRPMLGQLQVMLISRSKLTYPARRNAFAIGVLPRSVDARMRGASCSARTRVPSARMSSM